MTDISKYIHRTSKTGIEAARLSPQNISRLAAWANGHQVPYLHTEDHTENASLHIYGRTQMLVARHGDWVIKHPTQGINVLSNSLFTTLYVNS